MLRKKQSIKREFIENKIADAATKSIDDNIEKQEPVEEIIIPLEKRRNIKQIEKSITKMEHYKISKVLNDSTVSKFVTQKWVEVNDLSSGQYFVNKNIRFKISMLRSNLCDYNDALIGVKGRISVRGSSNANTRKKKPTFKNNAPFRSFISKINNTFIDNEDDLDNVMPMYNLSEYSDNYSKTSGSLWNYYRDEIND